MPPRKRKGKAKAPQDEVPAYLPQAVPDTLQLAYHGPDRLSKLPRELRLRVCTFLHAPGEARWDDKSDLKALHAAGRELRDFAKEELFRYMSLNFNHKCEYDRPIIWTTSGIGIKWYTPNLIKMIEEEPALASYVRAVRVQILPVPIPVPRPSRMRWLGGPFEPYLPDLPTDASGFLYFLEQARAQEIQLAANESSAIDTFGYIDDSNTLQHTGREPAQIDRGWQPPRQPNEHPDDQYYHLFAPRRHFFQYPEQPPFEWTHLFAKHVLDSMRHRILPSMLSLKHLEGGAWRGPKPDDWTKQQFEFVSQWGLAFANAVILKTSTYERISSLGIRGLPYKGQREQSGWETYGVRQVLARVMHFGSS